MAHFVVFEGIDGSGKTTQLKMLAGKLRSLGRSVKTLKEPTNGYWGKKIRSLCANTKPLTKEEELQLFIRDRRWNVTKNILPSLNSGKIVLQDRYYYSTACYQSRNDKEFQAIIAENRLFAPEPDIVFILLIDIETALQRILFRQNRQSYFEKKDFLITVQERYKLFQKEKNIVIINANNSPQEVFSQIWKHYAAGI